MFLRVVSPEGQSEARVGDDVSEGRAWKVFGLIPMMVLHRPRGTGAIGCDELANQVDHFHRRQMEVADFVRVREHVTGSPDTSSFERAGEAWQGSPEQGTTGTRVEGTTRVDRRAPRPQERADASGIQTDTGAAPSRESCWSSTQQSLCRWRCARSWIVCEVR